jgi:hypothetical protein
MANNFCRFHSKGYRIESNGNNLTYSPCCWYNRKISLFDPHFDTQKNDISKIQNWVPECGSCRQIEESGAYGDRSPRLMSFEKIPDGTIPDNVPAWMEITIDTTCNAACIMCGPYHSTTWRKQEIKFGFKTPDQVTDPVTPMVWLNVIKNKFPLNFVKSISFLGGEPFESSVPQEFLTLLKSTHGSLSDVSVKFSTNASIRPGDQLLDLLAECKSVTLTLSIDGIGERFEYVRYPILWSRIEPNISYMKSLNLPDMHFNIVSTINALNIYYFDELEHWAQTMFNDESLRQIKPNKSVGTVALAQTPLSLRHLVFSKFGTEHSISKLISNLPVVPIDNCIKWLDLLDSHRKIYWRQVFPEIAPSLEKLL